MKKRRGYSPLFLLLGIAILGCGTGAKPTGKGDTGSAVGANDSSPIKRRAASDLPKVDENLPDVDNGRLKVLTPEGWKPAPRDKSYLVRFYQTDKSGPPRLIVTGQDSPYTDFDSVTEENVIEFAAKTDELLKAGTPDLNEPPKPMILGNTPWARYTLKGRLNNIPIDRQVLRTVVGKRMYVVELQVLAGQITQYRDSAYAVAAGMKFLGGGAAEKPTTETPAAEATKTEEAQPDKPAP